MNDKNNKFNGRVSIVTNINWKKSTIDREFTSPEEFSEFANSHWISQWIRSPFSEIESMFSDFMSSGFSRMPSLRISDFFVPRLNSSCKNWICWSEMSDSGEIDDDFIKKYWLDKYESALNDDNKREEELNTKRNTISECELAIGKLREYKTQFEKNKKDDVVKQINDDIAKHEKTITELKKELWE